MNENVLPSVATPVVNISLNLTLNDRFTLFSLYSIYLIYFFFINIIYILKVYTKNIVK